MSITSFINHPAYNMHGHFTTFARSIMWDLRIAAPAGWYFELDANEFKCQVINVGRSVVGPEYFEFRVHQEIRISDGVPKLIYDLLKIILSDNDLFPGVGKSNRRVTVQNIFLPNYKIYDLASPNIEDPELDEERTKLLELSYMMVLTFLFTHEATHITDGHMSYFFSKDDSIKTINDVEFNLERHCLEVFADTYAVLHCLDYWLEGVSVKAEIIPGKVCTNNYIIRLYIFSLFFLQRVLTTSTPVNQTYEDDLKRKHPISAYRWGAIINTLYQELTKMKATDMDFIEFQIGVINPIVNDLEITLDKVSINKKDGFNNEYERMQTYYNLEYGTALRKQYESISHLLNQFRSRDIYKCQLWY